MVHICDPSTQEAEIEGSEDWTTCGNNILKHTIKHQLKTITKCKLKYSSQRDIDT